MSPAEAPAPAPRPPPLVIPAAAAAVAAPLSASLLLDEDEDMLLKSATLIDGDAFARQFQHHAMAVATTAAPAAPKPAAQSSAINLDQDEVPHPRCVVVHPLPCLTTALFLLAGARNERVARPGLKPEMALSSLGRLRYLSGVLLCTVR